jgi:uncharacterized protein (TIGR02271 family)
MAGTLIQLFDNAATANSARDRLLGMGLKAGDIRMMYSPSKGVADRNSIDDLTRAGIPSDRAQQYFNEVKMGRSLIAVIADDARRAQIEQILGVTTTATTATQSGDLRQQVIQEDLLVGKRQVESGGFRVTAHTSQTPVDEKVNLHEEHVEIERHAVDRPVTPADLGRNLNAQDEVVEYHDMREEPVVTKRARVVEEVVIRKTGSDHTENIHDTVRRRDINIQPIRKGDSSSTPDLSKHEPDFRRAFDENMTNSGYTYEQMNPAYEYGANLASDAKYKGKRWEDVEGSARSEWESRNPGTWERIKSAVQHSWEKIAHADEHRL